MTIIGPQFRAARAMLGWRVRELARRSIVSIPTILFIVALVLALVDEFQAQGKSLVGWAAVFIAIGLLWGNLG